MSQGYLGLGIEEVIAITSACDLMAGGRAPEDALAVLVFLLQSVCVYNTCPWTTF
jgi:hypothetical protein